MKKPSIKLLMIAIIVAGLVFYIYTVVVKQLEFAEFAKICHVSVESYSYRIKLCDLGIQSSEERSKISGDLNTCIQEKKWWYDKKVTETTKQKFCKDLHDYYTKASRFPWMYPSARRPNLPPYETLPPPDLPPPI